MSDAEIETLANEARSVVVHAPYGVDNYMALARWAARKMLEARCDELKRVGEALNGVLPRHEIRLPPYGPSAYAQAMNEIVDVLDARRASLAEDG